MSLSGRARAEKLPFQDVQRARIVLYAAEGMRDTEIAARLDTSPGSGGASGEDGSPSDRLEGLQGQAARGSPAPFSPRSRSPRSRRSRASCRSGTGCRWAGSPALSCTGW